MALTLEQIAEFRQKYNLVPTEPIKEDRGFLGSPIEATKEFAIGIGGAIKERGERIGEEIFRAEQKEISPARSALRVSGQVAGTMGDIAFEGLKFLAPNFVESIVGKGVGKVGEIEIAQNALRKYQELQIKHPEAMKDIEAIFNISSLIPIAKGVETTIGGVARVAEKGGKILERGAISATKQLEKAKEATRLTLFGRSPQVIKSIDDVIKQADKELKPAEILIKTGQITAKPSLAQRWAGISPDIKNRIAGKQEKLKEYFDVAHARNNFDTLPTPLEYGAKNVEKATSKMEEILNDTGSKIGSFRNKIGTYEANFNQIKQIDNSFNNEISKLNLKLDNGIIKQIPGTITRVGSKNDIKVLQELYNDLRTLKENPNLEKLIDLRNQFDRKINFEKQARDISNAVDPVSRNIRKQIADVGADIVGKSEALNLKKYSDFIDGYNELRGFTDRKSGAEFLLKQVLSERGRTSREVMNTIKEFTGIDLMDDAVMASIATDLIGNARQKGLFRQEITKAGLDAQAILRGDTKGAIELMGYLLKKGLVNEEKQFLKAAKENPIQVLRKK